jgi:uncharacterized protein
MPGDTIEQWEQTQAEIEIRRWLYSIGLWAPGAERSGRLSSEEAGPVRPLTVEQVDQTLRSEVVGRLGCHAEGKTYIVPVAYVYDGQCIYGHTGEGMKLHMLRANPEVCFEVDQVESLTTWRSVIVWGQFEELHGAEAKRALRLLAERIRPLLADNEREPADAAAHYDDVEEQRPVVYRIRLTEHTGRYSTRS